VVHIAAIAILRCEVGTNRAPLGAVPLAILEFAGRAAPFGFFRLWRRWEPVAMWLWRVRPVRPGAVLQFGISPYRGHTTQLRDRTVVRRGDRILHLHLHNGVVAALAGQPGSNPWSLIDQAGRDLDALAELVACGEVGEVRAVRGVTVLARAAARLGFEVRPLPRNLRWSLIRTLSALVLASYHRGGAKELERGVAWPGEVWLSSQALERRLNAGRRPGSGGEPDLSAAR